MTYSIYYNLLRGGGGMFALFLTEFWGNVAISFSLAFTLLKLQFVQKK